MVFINFAGMVMLNNPFMTLLCSASNKPVFIIMESCCRLFNQNHQQVSNDFDGKGHVYYGLIQLKILQIIGCSNSKTRYRSLLKYSDLRATQQSFTPQMTGHIPGRGGLLPGHLLTRLQLPGESGSYKAYTQSSTGIK